MDRIKVERAIAGLTEWRKHVQANSDIDRDISTAIEALKAQLSQEGSQEGTTSDLISRTETVEHLRRMLEATVPNTDYDEGFIDGVEFGVSTVSAMPPAQPETLTDKEQRIFLAAMGREEKVCRQVDDECGDCRDSDSLVRTCHEITRKVKGTLWT